jgi:uncharacterized protein
MQNIFIGRVQEREILAKTLSSPDPELVAVVGRRRIGKTYLVRQCFDACLDFEVTGLQHVTQKEQLQNFVYHIKKWSAGAVAPPQPQNWLEAFQFLADYLDTKSKDSKLVVFFDELPWMASRKSGFLAGLSFFWNSWATRKNIVVVICGSAASWIVQKVVEDKGGLHNRITKRIDLQPFNLHETELFLKSRQVNLSRYQILQIYMALGGVPHYLKEIENGKSAAQNIDKICFAKSAQLKNEFSRLYPALFENAENHVAVVRALAGKWKGMTRKEIIEASKLPEGGGTTRILEELLMSGFIAMYNPFGKKRKDTFYRLTDEFSLFFLEFMENKRYQYLEVWQQLSQTPAYKSWSGYAFESICIKHIAQIKKALGISGVYAEASSFIGKNNEKGLQIDLVLDRKDQIINLFEIKFYNQIWQLTKSDAAALTARKELFRDLSKTRKHIFLTVLSTFGIQQNEHSLGVVDNNLTMDCLFEPD